MESLRELPSVDELWRRLAKVDGLPPELVKNEIRTALEERRRALRSGGAPGEETLEKQIEARLQSLLQPSLRKVINATGVVLHTNLGRAPLPHFEPVDGYSNLEYDLDAGRRGKRDVHAGALLERLLGKPAIVVNNNAAAVFLVLHELAAGGEAIVSRGELIEIGDGFRIPDIMERSGTVLREIGTTNRTRLEDYEQAITDRTRLMLRVHPSNFHVSGFTARPGLKELAGLARERGIVLFEDLGSGCVVDLRAYGVNEPMARESLAAGVHVVCFSCDKLLGGPQAGIIAGDKQLVDRIRRNPMYRAFRVDKLILQSLEVTLRHILRQAWDQVPALRMIFAPLSELRARAERVRGMLGGVTCEIREAHSPIGGGSTPDQALATCCLELTVADPVAFERRLRTAATPVIARIERDRIVLDMRTVSGDEESSLSEAVRAAAAE